MKSMKLSTLAAAVALALPFAASAESNFQQGGGALVANAKLNFSIVIPKVLYLRVGTGTLLTTVATVDTLTFTVPAASVGNGVSVAATGGTAGPSAVTAHLIGNNGDISFNVTTGGALTNATADTIPYTQISNTVTTFNTATALAAPTLVNGAGTAITIPATSKVVNRDATWTFAYLNTNTVAPGTYGTGGGSNGVATYTASLP